ncbi:putative cytochrome p450 protein [Botrytis cinerea BcDW1]|uniref:Similar to cytochrome P450 n=2 Tax=Botryotinia fuckeliana TaxID=40559 RepID=G2YQG9_BOTF4|nr:putative cytochrome p450 protein [Botrytis cinerea BcDW1]CCD53867.1 similar to cytochrome P450 [Botrytis cinerea T4]
MNLLFASLAAIVSFVWFLHYVFGVKRDSKEPPYIDPKFPIIGHAVGLLREKYGYYIALRFASHFIIFLWKAKSFRHFELTRSRPSEKYKLRIFGLAIPGMPGGRVYIINSPELVLAVQRQSKQLSFWHVEATFTVGMAGLSPHAAKIVTHNVNGEEEGTSFFKSGMTLQHQEMQPGEHLLNITRDGTQKLARTVSRLEEITRIDLNQWIVDTIMDSVTGSFYGPRNPYKDPEISKAFRDFEDNAVGLISFPLPKVTCRKAYQGREKMVDAFLKYYADEGTKTASHIVQSQDRVATTSGISLLDRARIDAVSGHAILANTTPTAFWTVFHLLSDPKLVEEVRNAVEPFVKTSEKNGHLSREMDISKIRDVPIIRSILHESLRHYADGTGTRIVLQDTMLDDKYLLKKDSFIFMPNRAYHFDESSWGTDVDNFDAHRFMKSKPYQPGAFRGFGGGINLCPGRFYAMNEISFLCSMLVLRYDVKPVGGAWIHPGADSSNLSLIINPPIKKVLVDFKPRAGWAGGDWSFTL